MGESSTKTTTRKADVDTVAALKRMLREAGVSTSEGVGVQDDNAKTSADAGAGANSTADIGRNEGDGDTVASLKRLLKKTGATAEGCATSKNDSSDGAGVNSTADIGRNDGDGDTVASLKRLLKNTGATAEGCDTSKTVSSDGADAGAGAGQSKKNNGDVHVGKQSDDDGSRKEGGDTIADLKRLIKDAEEEKRKRDLLISNQRKEMEDMQARLEQVRLAKGK